MSGPPILSLPVEITQHAIVACHPNDVAAIAKSCRRFHNIIYSSSDTHIWRSLFLSLFDDPRLRAASYALGHTSNPNDIWMVAQQMDYNWTSELQRRIAAMNLIKNKTRALNATTSQRREALEAFISVVDTSSPPFPFNSHSNDDATSKNLSWLYNILDAADALNHTVWPSLRNTLFASLAQYPSSPELSARSKLHVYLGLTYSDRQSESTDSSTSSSFAHSSLTNSATFINHSTGSPDSHRYALRSIVTSDHGQNQTKSSPDLSLPIPFTQTRYPSLRTTARAMVYDIRNYAESSLYGPFHPEDSFSTMLKDGRPQWRVNWRHVEALMMVVAWNIEEELGPETMLAYGRPVISLPMGLKSLRPWSAPGFPIGVQSDLVDDFRSRDWAGVEGRWNRVVCFLDYRDFFHFNFSSSTSEAELNTELFEEHDFAEAMRVLRVELRITHIEEDADASITTSFSTSASSLPSVPPYGIRPRIFFEGESERGTPNESRLRGFVESNPVTGDIRWWMVSIYGGEERWSSEGVQIGGVGSKTGIVGCWTGANHAEADPAGPYWMWKLE